MTPAVATSLQGHHVTQLRGGQHHTLALTQVCALLALLVQLIWHCHEYEFIISSQHLGSHNEDCALLHILDTLT